MTQVERLRLFLESHPQASSGEIQSALHLTNATGRMSELRRLGESEGFHVVKERRSDNQWGYRLVLLHPVQGELFEMAS